MDFAGQLAFLDQLLLTSVTTEFPDPLTETERASVNAYLVLSHACVEEFIEDAFSRHFTDLTDWLVAPLVPREVGAVLFSIGLALDPQELPHKSRNFKGVVNVGAARFDQRVQANNGVKSGNVKNLAAGVGLDWARFEQRHQPQLADLDTLGAKRGTDGHLSPFSSKSVNVTQQLYPDEVRGWVADGRDAALAVDRYLRAQVQDQINSLATLGASDP